jgi:hypothetical protein
MPNTIAGHCADNGLLGCWFHTAQEDVYGRVMGAGSPHRVKSFKSLYLMHNSASKLCLRASFCRLLRPLSCRYLPRVSDTIRKFRENQMAELREADKRTLLGENYRETEMRFSADDGVLTPAEELRNLKTRQAKTNDARFSAVGAIFLGVVLALASYYRAKETVDIAAVSGAVILVFGIAWYVWLIQRSRSFAEKVTGLEKTLQA